MDIRKSLRRFIAISAASILLFSVFASAAVYKDVPSWASAAVDKITSLGYMTGDMSGNFNPNELVDKFATVSILAKMSGYKYTNPTQAEQATYDSYYKKNEGFISLYAKKFSKWNSGLNKEIAYLIEKNILVNSDLDQFVVIVDGQERLRALWKEEAAQFLVRLMGKENEALQYKSSFVFADDASITQSFKPYVYYLKSLNIISGDTSNKFNPKSGVSKVIMAAMVYGVYNVMNPGQTPATQAPSTPQPSGQQGSSNYETVNGTIAKLYSSFKAIQVSSSNAAFNNKIYIVGTNATITVNGVPKTYSELQEGMSFTGVLSNSELVTVAAQTLSAAYTQPPATQAPVQTQAPVSTPSEMSTVEGTVSSVNSENGANYVGIELRLLNPRGEIYAETRNYTLAGNCTILRSGQTIAFSGITKGDIIKAKVSGSNVYSIELEQKNRVISGEIIDKQFNTASSMPVITITDSEGVTYYLKVTSKSKIYRGASNTTSWSNLRIGDSVDVTTQYDEIDNLTAYGSINNKEGYIKDIYISATVCRLTLTDVNGIDKNYVLVSGEVDPYTLKIGSRVRLRLDSAEVQGVTLLEDSKTASLTGTVTYITSKSLTLKDSSTNYQTSKTVTLDSNTVFIDASTGNKVNYNHIITDMKVFVVFSDSTANLAKTVIILSR